MRPALLFIILTACFFKATSQIKAGESYVAGFRTKTIVDSSRLYKPNTSINNRLHFRPLDLDIWYPSLKMTSRGLTFGDLFKLFEQRANKYQDKKDYTGITEELALQFAVESGLKPENGKRLLTIATNSYRNSIPLREKKPLILYMAGLNGMSFENYVLLENLAQNGYVVVSISSIGQYPGDMTNKKADMMEQVYDAESAIKALKDQKEIKIDFEKIGVIGCSWGGMSAAVLINRSFKIKALISLDGSENHTFGENDDDDKNLKDIDTSNLLNEDIKDISYLYLTSDNSPNSTPSDRYSYFEKVQVPKYYLSFTGSRHEDFTCIPFLLKSSRNSINTYNAVVKSSLLFFNQMLSNKEGFIDYYNELKSSKNIDANPTDVKKLNTITAVLTGTVFDSSGNPLPYVNVGVINNELGTVTDERGQFKINLKNGSIDDTLRISMIGYKARIFQIKDLLNQNPGVSIKLEKDIQQLEEVVVSFKKTKSKILGNKTTSKFLGTPFNNRLGAEIGIKIPIRRQPTFVDAFNFNISYNTLNTKVWFRLNIYDMKNGKPSKNILSENILIPIDAKQKGLISTDLKPYDIVLSDDIMISLEWVKNETEPGKGEVLVLSVGLLSGGTYVKPASQGKMKKHSNLGVGFNLNVRH